MKLIKINILFFRLEYAIEYIELHIKDVSLLSRTHLTNVTKAIY